MLTFLEQSCVHCLLHVKHIKSIIEALKQRWRNTLYCVNVRLLLNVCKGETSKAHSKYCVKEGLVVNHKIYEGVSATKELRVLRYLYLFILYLLLYTHVYILWLFYISLICTFDCSIFIYMIFPRRNYRHLKWVLHIHRILERGQSRVVDEAVRGSTPVSRGEPFGHATHFVAYGPIILASRHAGWLMGARGQSCTVTVGFWHSQDWSPSVTSVKSMKPVNALRPACQSCKCDG